MIDEIINNEANIGPHEDKRSSSAECNSVASSVNVKELVSSRHWHIVGSAYI
jgi:hypothetical protein